MSGALAHYELPFEKLSRSAETGVVSWVALHSFGWLFEFRNVPRDVIHFSGLEVRTCRLTRVWPALI